MKELLFKAYLTIKKLESLSNHIYEENTILTEKYQIILQDCLEKICKYTNNPVMMRYTLNPEPVKHIVVETGYTQNNGLSFNDAFKHIFKEANKL